MEASQQSIKLQIFTDIKMRTQMIINSRPVASNGSRFQILASKQICQKICYSEQRRLVEVHLILFAL